MSQAPHRTSVLHVRTETGSSHTDRQHARVSFVEPEKEKQNNGWVSICSCHLYAYDLVTMKLMVSKYRACVCGDRVSPSLEWSPTFSNKCCCHGVTTF
jgi:hypothetical protein